MHRLGQDFCLASPSQLQTTGQDSLHACSRILCTCLQGSYTLSMARVRSPTDVLLSLLDEAYGQLKENTVHYERALAALDQFRVSPSPQQPSAASRIFEKAFTAAASFGSASLTFIANTTGEPLPKLTLPWNTTRSPS